jgi:hypothetical protein
MSTIRLEGHVFENTAGLKYWWFLAMSSTGDDSFGLVAKAWEKRNGTIVVGEMTFSTVIAATRYRDALIRGKEENGSSKLPMAFVIDSNNLPEARGVLARRLSDGKKDAKTGKPVVPPSLALRFAGMLAHKIEGMGGLTEMIDDSVEKPVATAQVVGVDAPNPFANTPAFFGSF